MKISKEKLVQAIKGKIAQDQEKYEKECVEYLDSFKEVQEKVVEALQDAIKAAKSAKEFAHLRFLNHNGYGGSTVVPLNVNLPRKPEKPYEIGYAEKHLRKLELCVEDFVTVRDNDDLSRYI